MPLLIVALAIVAPRTLAALVITAGAVALVDTMVDTIATHAADRAIAKNAIRPA